jgi:hypothetical protein
MPLNRAGIAGADAVSSGRATLCRVHTLTSDALVTGEALNVIGLSRVTFYFSQGTGAALGAQVRVFFTISQFGGVGVPTPEPLYLPLTPTLTLTPGTPLVLPFQIAATAVRVTLLRDPGTNVTITYAITASI